MAHLDFVQRKCCPLLFSFSSVVSFPFRVSFVEIAIMGRGGEGREKRRREGKRKGRKGRDKKSVLFSRLYASPSL